MGRLAGIGCSRNLSLTTGWEICRAFISQKRTDQIGQNSLSKTDCMLIAIDGTIGALIQSLPYYNEGCLVRDLRDRARYNRARYNRSIGGKLNFFVFFFLKTVLN